MMTFSHRASNWPVGAERAPWFSLAGLDTRRIRPELMDQSGLDAREHARALAGLRRINRLSRTSRALWQRIASLSPGTRLRILDVACGGGDNLAALAREAARAGRAVELEGCDISPTAVACARDAAAAAGLPLRFFTCDALGGSLPEGYDVVMCSLYLHHLESAQALVLLRNMAASASSLVVVDDLVRSRAGYLLAWAGCRLLSRSPIVHYDGPVSVAAAWRPDEAVALASRAGLKNVSVGRHWPQRFLLAGAPR